MYFLYTSDKGPIEIIYKGEAPKKAWKVTGQTFCLSHLKWTNWIIFLMATEPPSSSFLLLPGGTLDVHRCPMADTQWCLIKMLSVRSKTKPKDILVPI